MRQIIQHKAQIIKDAFLEKRRTSSSKKKQYFRYFEVMLGLICALMSYIFHIMIERMVF